MAKFTKLNIGSVIVSSDKNVLKFGPEINALLNNYLIV